jgi:hypothetical protein
MLRNYLADDGVVGSDTLQYMSLNEVIRDGKIARDKQRVSGIHGLTNSSNFSNSQTPMRAVTSRTLTRYNKS